MAGLVALALAASLAPTVAGAAGATARAAGGTPASAAAAPGGFVADGVDGVRIHDRAVTARKAVTLSARPLTVAARWKLNEEQTGDKPATSPDEGSFGHDLTLAGDAYVDPQGGWVGNPPGALVLDGDGDYAATATPVIHTKQSFSVTGWVYTSGRPTHNAAIFSQEGSVNSAFTLRYAPDPSDPEEAGGYQIDIPDRDAAGAGLTAFSDAET